MTEPRKTSGPRSLRWFLFGQAASFLGDGVIGVALAFAVLDEGGSATDVGWVMAARSVTMVGFLLFGGVIADRVTRRNILVGCDVARLAAQAAMAALVIGAQSAIWPLVALNALHGMASGLFAPAAIGIVPSIAPLGRLQQANAMRGMAYSLGNIAGPALAGVLVTVLGPGQAIGAAAAAYLVSALMLARLPATAPEPASRRSALLDLREGWTQFRSRRWVWATAVFSSLGNLLLAAFLVLGPVIAQRSLGGPSAWAVVMTALGAGAFAGGLAALRIRPGHPLRTAVPLASLCALPPLALAADLPVAVTAALTFTAGTGLTIFNTLWETSLQKHIPHHQLSRVSSWDDFGSFLCQPLGQTLAGPLAAGIGITSTLWLAGGLQIAVTALLLCLPAIRMLPADPAHTKPGTDQKHRNRTEAANHHAQQKSDLHPPGFGCSQRLRPAAYPTEVSSLLPGPRTGSTTSRPTGSAAAPPVCKVAEECGEAVAAFISATGQNPRKSRSGDLAGVEKELLDVAVAALAADAHLHADGPEPPERLAVYVEGVAERVGPEVSARPPGR